MKSASGLCIYRQLATRTLRDKPFSYNQNDNNIIMIMETRAPLIAFAGFLLVCYAAGYGESESAAKEKTMVAAEKYSRFLQDEDIFNVPGSSCTEDGRPLLEGSTLDTLFADQYHPNCTCMSVSNVGDANNLFNDGFDLDLFSEFISNLNIDIEWTCKNKCATCFPTSDCGIFLATSKTDYNGIPTNFTTDDLLNLASMNLGFEEFLRGSQMEEYCFEYTAGQSGRVCYGSTVDVETIASNTTELPCFISYDGVKCNACVLLGNCWIADCDNHGVPIVNTCNGTGVDSGVFQILAYYANSTDPSDLIVESECANDRPNGTFCGGIAGISCPDRLECVDDPNDDCDPAAGGADCGGICATPSKVTPNSTSTHSPITNPPTASQVPSDNPDARVPSPSTTNSTGTVPPSGAPTMSESPTKASDDGSPTSSPSLMPAPTIEISNPTQSPVDPTNASTQNGTSAGARRYSTWWLLTLGVSLMLIVTEEQQTTKRGVGCSN